MSENINTPEPKQEELTVTAENPLAGACVSNCCGGCGSKNSEPVQSSVVNEPLVWGVAGDYEEPVLAEVSAVEVSAVEVSAEGKESPFDSIGTAGKFSAAGVVAGAVLGCTLWGATAFVVAVGAVIGLVSALGGYLAGGLGSLVLLAADSIKKEKISPEARMTATSENGGLLAGAAVGVAVAAGLAGGAEQAIFANPASAEFLYRAQARQDVAANSTFGQPLLSSASFEVTRNGKLLERGSV